MSARILFVFTLSVAVASADLMVHATGSTGAGGMVPRNLKEWEAEIRIGVAKYVLSVNALGESFRFEELRKAMDVIRESMKRNRGKIVLAGNLDDNEKTKRLRALATMVDYAANMVTSRGRQLAAPMLMALPPPTNADYARSAPPEVLDAALGI